MRSSVLAIAVLLAAWTGPADAAEPVVPFETGMWSIPATGVDTRVLSGLQQKGIEPALPCSDEVFVRRIYLDVIGTLPTPHEVRSFLADERPDRRARLIESLFDREEFAEFWTLKWCDLLRVKAEFPINLWPNAVQAYHRWVYEAVRDNHPYDEFARSLLTSSGSNFRAGPVNFYRAAQTTEPDDLAGVVALTFMGTRLANWPQDRRDEMAAFFSRLSFKGTDEWKEEIVFNDPTVTEPLRAVFPDGTSVIIQPHEDARVVFADWLIDPQNPWFTRAIANRVWSWFLGRGIIHEPDDIRPEFASEGNPPVNPELLSYLEEELVAADYDLRELFRLILNSRTYQQSSIARSDHPEAETLFASYPVRRMKAEVLIDALDWIGGTAQQYESRIPEPFTWIPEENRTIALADGSITTNFLQMFGRPARDTGYESERSLETSDAQRLFLLNSTDVYRRIARSIHLQRIAIEAGDDDVEIIRGIYLLLLSRYPTADELGAVREYWRSSGLDPDDARIDLAWSLINSMEFLYRH
jgi:hypothetical protein